jgi:hypothetical protein
MKPTESNIVPLFAEIADVLDMPAADILNGAIAQDLEAAIIIGRRKDGSTYLASSIGYKPDIAWHMEEAQALLLSQST